MIKVNLSKDEYEYDIHSLVKAFYPEELVKVIKPISETSAIDVLNENEAAGSFKEHKSTLKQDNKNESTEEADCLEVFIMLKEHEITIKVLKVNTELYKQTQGIQVKDYELSKASKQQITSVIKKHYRNLLKRMLYQCLSQLTNRKLPWGTLTGVRPTKIAFERLEIGVSNEDIRTYMEEEYLCSQEKIDLSLEVAEREIKLLKDMDYKKGYSIYIGIPFCPSTCLYCSFTSYSYEKFGAETEAYLQALMKEITYEKTCYPDKILSTVYLGGGTPTTLTAAQLEKLLSHIRNTFDFTNVLEFTVEAGRPDSITLEKLKVLKTFGVTRISINPQSMRQKTLDIIGRKHTVTQVAEAFHMARSVGHDNINMDIILGLPGEGCEDVEYTLSEIDKLQPDSLTVHTLAIKRAARLNIEKDNYRDMASTETTQMLKLTADYTKKADYLPYYLYRQKNMSDNLENIGYAKFGKEGLYNILIMEEKQTILALGAGALSKFVFHEENRIERVENVKSLKDYINRIDEMVERKKQFLMLNP